MDIDIRPEVNILGVLRHLNYKPWFALAEFIDNAVVSATHHALVSVETPLRVSVALDPVDGGRIVIRDNAGGIAPEDFPRAFRAAQVPPDRSGLSEFGMGMKSAASWFAREWRVTTSVDGDPVERVIHFNIEDIQANNRHTIAVKEFEASATAHYTTIELLGLHRVPQTKTLSKIKSHLASIYREFLRKGVLDLEFRGEKILFNEVEPLVAARADQPNGEKVRWLKEIDFAIDDTRHVKGFAGLRARGSTAEAGFALFRRGRLIVGSADETYRPVEIFGRSTTHTYQRLYGELTLEGFEVSHTKDGFRWDEYEDIFLELLRDQLSAGDMDLLRQASNYRLQPVSDNRRPVEKAMTQVASSVANNFGEFASRDLAERKPEEYVPDRVTSRTSPDRITRLIRVELDDEVWIVELEATMDNGAVDWLAVGANQPSPNPSKDLPETRVQVSVNLAHPFSRKFLGPSNENTEMMVTFAGTIGLAMALGKRSGAKSQSIIRRINELARETFSTISGTEAG